MQEDFWVLSRFCKFLLSEPNGPLLLPYRGIGWMAVWHIFIHISGEIEIDWSCPFCGRMPIILSVSVYSLPSQTLSSAYFSLFPCSFTPPSPLSFLCILPISSAPFWCKIRLTAVSKHSLSWSNPCWVWSCSEPVNQRLVVSKPSLSWFFTQLSLSSQSLPSSLTRSLHPFILLFPPLFSQKCLGCDGRVLKFVLRGRATSCPLFSLLSRFLLLHCPPWSLSRALCWWVNESRQAHGRPGLLARLSDGPVTRGWR